jgi:phosphoglycolate phosphatase
MTDLNPRDISAILFDKDGTLFDFGATWNAWATSFLSDLAEGDRDRAVALGALIGFDLDAGVYAPDSFVIAGTPDDLVEALVPEFPNLSRETLFRLINDEAAATPMVEAVSLAPLLKRLAAAGLRLGVAPTMPKRLPMRILRLPVCGKASISSQDRTAAMAQSLNRASCWLFVLPLV